MGLESGTYIDSLNSANPVGVGDPKSEGDDHLRLIKSTLQATLPNLTGAVTATHTDLNNLTGHQGVILTNYFVDGTGTVNAITATFPTGFALTDKVTVMIKAFGQITVTNPTFSPNGLTAKVIVKADGDALTTADIRSSNQTLILQYDSTLDNWILLNPVAAKSRGCLVYNSINVTVADATTVALTFDTEDYDTDTIHSTSSNTDRLTVPTWASKVVVAAQWTWAANTTNFRRMEIRKNGTIAYPGSSRSESTPVSVGGITTTEHLYTAEVDVSGGDYFQLVPFQNTGGNLDIVGGATGSNTWFYMKIIE